MLSLLLVEVDLVVGLDVGVIPSHDPLIEVWQPLLHSFGVLLDEGDVGSADPACQTHGNYIVKIFQGY